MKKLAYYKNRLLAHTVTLEGLTPTGKQAVSELLKTYNFSITRDWNWGDELRGKTNAPKLATRLSKHIYEEYGSRLDSDTLTQIGNLSRLHRSVPSTYQFDFVQKFDWEDGEFGDGDSCFWGGGRTGAIPMLEANGAWAIRFFKKGNGDYYAQMEGFARAWIVETGPLQVVFNGYGLQTIDIARIFADWSGGLAYKRIELNNNASASGELWLNNKGHGYVIGTPELIEPVSSIDFGWENVRACDWCNETFKESELKDDACPACFAKHSIVCSLCEERVVGHCTAKHNGTEIRVCYECRSHAASCDQCWNYTFQWNRWTNIFTGANRYYCTTHDTPGMGWKLTETRDSATQIKQGERVDT